MAPPRPMAPPRLTALSTLSAMCVLATWVELNLLPLEPGAARALSRPVDVRLRDDPAVRTTVARIVHDRHARQVHVDVSAAANCTAPTFLMRVSGAALSTRARWSSRGGRHTGHYRLCYPPEGAASFHLEIQLVTCAPRHLYEAGDPRILRAACIVDPEHSVVNAPYSFRDRPAGPEALEAGPCWLADPASRAAALATRFQPPMCFPYERLELPPSRARKAGYSPRPISNRTRRLCDLYADLRRFEPYHMDPRTIGTWRSAWTADSGLNGTTAVCVLGDSHASALAGAMRAVAARARVRLSVLSLTFRYPSELAAPGALVGVARARRCSVVVLHMGQWSAGWPRHRPDSAAVFRTELEPLLAVLDKLVTETALASAWVLSLNYNPVGAMVAACPPTDWRSRPLVDAYNRAVAAAVESHPHVGYIDNGPILDPMWDSAGDWCHYHGRVAEAMAHHTLYQVSRG